MHQPCMAATRCFRRLVEKSGKPALREHDGRMLDDPESWRADVAPLVKVGGKRSGAARCAAKQRLVREKATFVEKGVISDSLVLTKRQYKKFKREWDDMSSSSASAHFDRELKKQRGKHSTGEQSMIAVADIKRIRNYEGTRNSTKEQDIEDNGNLGVDVDSHCASRSRSRQHKRRKHKRAGRSKDRRPRDRKREKQGSDRKASRREAPSTSAGSASDHDIFDEEAKSTALDNSTRKKKKKSSSRTESVVGNDGAPRRILASLTRGNLGRHEDEVSSESPAPRSAKKDPSTPTSKALTPVAVMREKAELKEKISQAITHVSGPKSVMKKLSAALQKLDSGLPEVGQVSGDAKRACDDCHKVSKALNGLKGRVDGLQTKELDHFKAELAEKTKESEKAISTCHELSEAVAFIHTQGRTQQRKVSNQVRFQRRKMQNRLIVGGYGPNYSKQLVPMLESLSEKVTEKYTFAVAEFGVLSADSEAAKKLRATVVGDTLSKNLEMKKESLHSALEEHQKWGGAVCKVECAMDTIAAAFPEGVEAAHLDHKGSCPWLIALRPFHLRFGPSAFPVPGVGAFIVPLGQSITLAAIPIPALLSKGIAPVDFPTFAESPSGSVFLAESCKLAKVDDGAVAWLPYGWVGIPLAWAALKNTGGDEVDEPQGDEDDPKATDKATPEKTQDKDSNDIPAGFALHIPCFNKDLGNTVPAAAWKAIVHWNSDHLAKHERTKLWTSRAELFFAFAKEFGDEYAATS